MILIIAMDFFRNLGNKTEIEKTQQHQKPSKAEERALKKATKEQKKLDNTKLRLHQVLDYDKEQNVLNWHKEQRAINGALVPYTAVHSNNPAPYYWDLNNFSYQSAQILYPQFPTFQDWSTYLQTPPSTVIRTPSNTPIPTALGVYF